MFILYAWAEPPRCPCIPPRFFNCLMHGRKCGARAYSPFDASCIASYTILRRRMALPPPLQVRSGLVQFVSVYVWSGSVRSCLVPRSGLIWSGPVRSAPLRSVPLMSAPLVLWLSSDSVVPRRCAKAISPISLAQSIVYNKLSTIWPRKLDIAWLSSIVLYENVQCTFILFTNR